MTENDWLLTGPEQTARLPIPTLRSTIQLEIAVKLLLQGLSLAALGAGFLIFFGYVTAYQFAVAMLVGVLLIYAGAAIAFGEMRRMYFRRQRERRDGR